MSHNPFNRASGMSCSPYGKTTKTKKRRIGARNAFGCTAPYKTGYRVPKPCAALTSVEINLNKLKNNNKNLHSFNQ